jgi:tetratricopeptide (TPR) repeat protein
LKLLTLALANNNDFSINDDNLETFALLWLDASVNSSEENRRAQQHLRSTINYLKAFEDAKQCQQYIQFVSPYNRIILIVSGQLGQEIVPRIHPIRQLSSIYVYCRDKKRNEQWAKDYPKLKAVTVQLADLISRIKIDQKSLAKIEDPLLINVSTVFDNAEQTTTGMNGQFVHSLLLIDVLLRMKPIKTDKQELIMICKNEYRGNTTNLDVLHDFQEKYSSQNSLWWYTRESFLYKMLNKALRTQNIDILFLFRFFIRDIRRELERYQCRLPIRVYRGQVLSNDELNKLRNSIGQFISINSFFSTTPHHSAALEFLKHCKTSDNLHQVLFEIDADPCVGTTKPFADITPYSAYPDESEILFMIGSIFRLTSIHQTYEQIWMIHLTLCGDDEHDLRKLFEYMKDSYADGESETTLLSFGHVLHKMGKFDQAEKCYHRLLNKSLSDNSTLSRLYYSLGLVTMDKGDYNSSLIWLNKSLQMKIQTNPSDYINISGMYNAIGNVYRMKNDYLRALEWYYKGVELVEREHLQDGPSIAHLYNNIAVVYQGQKKYSEALTFYEKSLNIRKKYLPSNHPDIGLSHNNIGNIHHCLGRYELALEHLEQSLKIKLKSLPPQHPQIGKSYKSIGLIYESSGKLKKAFQYFQKAAEIYKHSLPNDHPDIVKIHTNIQRVSSKLKESG